MTNLPRRTDGFKPDLPEDWGFVELARPVGVGDWCIARLGPPSSFWNGGDLELPPACEPLDEAWSRVLGSGLSWPPALAWAREIASTGWAGSPGDRQGFGRAYVDLVEAYLRGQPACPFFLALSLTQGLIGGRLAGAWVWIVSLEPNGRVGYVGHDFAIYRARAQELEISPERLEKLSTWMERRPAELATCPS
ncbi:MAG: hypothetical protein JXR96_27980 [Deltaproteobacteria bacterium]|nr:hypothetical protein [Deltaproteobacteria bacterium]